MLPPVVVVQLVEVQHFVEVALLAMVVVQPPAEDPNLEVAGNKHRQASLKLVAMLKEPAKVHQQHTSASCQQEEAAELAVVLRGAEAGCLVA